VCTKIGGKIHKRNDVNQKEKKTERPEKKEKKTRHERKKNWTVGWAALENAEGRQTPKKKLYIGKKRQTRRITIVYYHSRGNPAARVNKIKEEAVTGAKVSTPRLEPSGGLGGEKKIMGSKKRE